MRRVVHAAAILGMLALASLCTAARLEITIAPQFQGEALRLDSLRYQNPTGETLSVSRLIAQRGSVNGDASTVADHRLTGNEHVTKFNSFRLIRGQIARAAASVATERTYFDVALTWFTDRIGLLPLPLKDRRYVTQKTSGYTWYALARHALRLLLGCELKVLRAGALVGFVTLLLSVVLS